MDTVDHTVGPVTETGANTLVSDGTRLYRIGSEIVEIVNPDGLSPGPSYPTGRIAHWTATTGALYVGDDAGSLQRIDQDGDRCQNFATWAHWKTQLLQIVFAKMPQRIQIYFVLGEYSYVLV